MKNLSVVEMYLLCALNEKGKLPVIRNTEMLICALAGAIIDLVLEGCVEMSDKKLRTAAPLKEEHSCLKSVYDYIKEKEPVKIEKLGSDYCFTFTNARLNRLIDDVGESVGSARCVDVRQGDVWSNKKVFIPHKDAVDRIIQSVRAELLEEGSISDEIVALASLMDKSGILKRYFSDYEKKILKARLEEIRKSPAGELAGKLIDDTTMMIAVIAAVGGGGK